MRTKQLLKRASDVINDQASPKINKSNQRILYLSGDSKDSRFVEQQIRTLGYEILVARNQSEALALAKYWKPLVIISEISSNNIKGFELSRLLKEDARTNSIPFLFISDEKVKPDQLLGFQTGADDYIIKPWAPNEFRSRLNSLIQRNASEIILKRHSNTNNDKANSSLVQQKIHEKRRVAENIPEPSRSPQDDTAKLSLSLDAKPKPSDGPALYKDISTRLQDIFSKARKASQVDILRVQNLARIAVENLEQGNELLLHALHQRGEDFIIHDSINITIYSILVGKGLNYSHEPLVNLATAALINDIGFVKLPEKLLKPDHILSPDEIDLIQMHPIYGAQILKASLNGAMALEFAWLPTVVLQAHEREGGIGYPKGLKGNEINEFAKVIGIADTFNALLWEQTYKKGSVTYQALQKIIEMDGRYFSPKIKKALVCQISIFPLGTYVKLNSEQIGVVVDINKSHPTRPVIELLFDSQGFPVSKRELKNLAECPFLFITRVVSPDEIHKNAFHKS